MMSELARLPPEVLAELRAETAAWKPMVDSVHTFPRELRSVMGFRRWQRPHTVNGGCGRRP